MSVLQCELCGAEVEVLYKTVIEGTELMVCKKCSRFGTVKAVVKPKSLVVKEEKSKQLRKKQNLQAEPKQDLSIELIVPDFSERVKKAREKLGLKQEELAKKIAERESVIHNIESGRLEPSISLARKLERFLKIKLVEVVSEEASVKTKKQATSLTIGDVLKSKTKK